MLTIFVLFKSGVSGLGFSGINKDDNKLAFGSAVDDLLLAENVRINDRP